MHSCSKETHDKCENSSLCHLCDGVRLYKNSKEDFAAKMERRQQNKIDERKAAFRTHKAEKKEGMAFEKAVTKKWNAAFNSSEKEEVLFKQPLTKKTKIQKPRIQIDEPLQDVNTQPEAKPAPSITLSTLGATPNKTKRPIVDAKRQANSGALWYAKGDIKTQDYLMECKERGTLNARGEKTISIPKEWLTKQEMEAFQENRPFWVIPFRYKNDNTIYMIKSFDHEIEIYQEIRRLKEENEKLRSNKV